MPRISHKYHALPRSLLDVFARHENAATGPVEYGVLLHGFWIQKERPGLSEISGGNLVQQCLWDLLRLFCCDVGPIEWVVFAIPDGPRVRPV